LTLLCQQPRGNSPPFFAPKKERFAKVFLTAGRKVSSGELSGCDGRKIVLQ
jgi:hypothetical protein